MPLLSVIPETITDSVNPADFAPGEEVPIQNLYIYPDRLDLELEEVGELRIMSIDPFFTSDTYAFAAEDPKIIAVCDSCIAPKVFGIRVGTTNVIAYRVDPRGVKHPMEYIPVTVRDEISD